MPRRYLLGSAALLVVFLAPWEWAPGVLGIPRCILPPASSVWASFVEMARDACSTTCRHARWKAFDHGELDSGREAAMMAPSQSPPQSGCMAGGHWEDVHA